MKYLHPDPFDKEKIAERIQFVYDFHLNIINELFEGENRPVKAEVHAVFLQMDSFLVGEHTDYDYVYDQIVSKIYLRL